MRHPIWCHWLNVPHRRDSNPRRRAWHSRSRGFTPWYGRLEATLECRPGWEPPAMVARHGRRQGSRFDSNAWTILAVTSSRISVWLGIVVSLRCLSLIQLDRSARSFGLPPLSRGGSPCQEHGLGGDRGAKSQMRPQKSQSLIETFVRRARRRTTLGGNSPSTGGRDGSEARVLMTAKSGVLRRSRHRNHGLWSPQSGRNGNLSWRGCRGPSRRMTRRMMPSLPARPVLPLPARGRRL